MEKNAEVPEEIRGTQRGFIVEQKSARRWNGRVPPPVPDAWNHLTESIIGCAMEVHTALGPGLLERLYEEAMAYELRERSIPFERQKPVVVRYKSIELSGQRIDLLVDGLVIVELKAIEAVPDVHLSQMVSYMRSAKAPLGLLINFNVLRLKDGIFRRISPHVVNELTNAGLSALSPSDPL